jgi:hypothetical protein
VAELKMPNPRTTPDHTHGRSAGERSAGNMFMHMAATALGKEPFEISMSRTAQRRNYDGERGALFWAKDTAVQLTDPFSTRANDAEMLIVTDVSYYIDDWESVLSEPRPVMEYVFNPTTAGESATDYSFRFMEDGTLSADISGGGHYGHLLWGVHGDAIVCKTYGTGLLGWILRKLSIPKRATVHCIERYRVGDHTQVIGYFPTITASFPWSALLCTLQHTPIARINPVKDGFVRLVVQDHEGLKVSIARAGRYSSSTIPYETESQLLDIAQMTPDGKITNASVASAISENGPESRLWTVYLRSQPRPTEDLRIIDATRTRSANVAQFLVSDPYDPDAKDMMVPFMNDLIQGVGFSHANTRDNELVGILKRVVEVRSDVQMNGHIYRYVLEYLEQLSQGRRHFLHPVDPEDVIAGAKNERARAIYEDGDLQTEPEAPVLRTFGKAEMNAELKPMRNITTYPGFQKLSAAPYAQALSKYIGSIEMAHPSGLIHGFYAGGMKPVGIAYAITSICLGADFINQSDYSKMDGTISPCLRTFDTMLMCHLFAPQYHSDIRAVLRRTRSQSAVTRNGVFYQTGTGQGSGCMFTSIIQTLRSDFNIFLASRYQDPDHSALEAFIRPRLLLGDDAVIAGLHPDSLVRSSQSLGLKVKTCIVGRGESGVSFLSRNYGPGIWNGDASSCCTVVRAMGNFTRTTKSNTLAPEEKLVSKALSLWLTDANTPGVGPFVCKVLELAAAEDVAPGPDMDSWWSQWSKDEQYPNENDDNWMDSCIPLWLDFTSLYAEVGRATCLNDMLHLSACGEQPIILPYPEIGCVVGDELYGTQLGTSAAAELEALIREDTKQQRDLSASTADNVGAPAEAAVPTAVPAAANAAGVKKRKPRKRRNRGGGAKPAQAAGPRGPARPKGKSPPSNKANGGGTPKPVPAVSPNGAAPVSNGVAPRPGDGSGPGVG